MSTIIFIQVVLTMKKTLSIILCLALVILSFTACSSSNALTEENVTKTVDTSFEALKEFDTDKLQKYVDSSTLNTIANYAQKQEQFKTLGQAIFENLDYEIKDIDLDKKTVTITVKNKDLSEGAKKFAEEITSEYSGVQLLGKLNDVSFLNTKLAELKDLISKAKMEEDGIDITLNIEQGSKNLKLAFDDAAENAVSGGALNAIKSLS
jgi:hypothetical protein